MKRREEQLLTQAKKLFSEKGYHNLTVSEIVESLGIARGTFYLYFRNKDEIYRKVLEKLVEEISSCLKVVPKENPIEQIKENLKAVLELSLRDRELARLIVYHPYRLNPEFDAVLEEFFLRVEFLIRKAIARGKEAGIIKDCDERVISSAIVGGFLWTIKRAIEEENVNPERLAEELILFGLKGLLREE